MAYEITDEQGREINYRIEEFSYQICKILGIDPTKDMMLGFKVAMYVGKWVEDCKRAGVLKDE